MKKCPNCGHEADVKFCPECGTQMSDITPPSPEQSSAVNHLPEEVVSPYGANPSGGSSANTSSGNQYSTYGGSAGTTNQNQGTYNYKFAGDGSSASSDFQNPTYTIPKKEGVSSKTWFVVLFLIIFWPVGLYLMWSRKKFSKAARIIVTIIIGLLVVANVALSVQVANTAVSELDIDTDHSTPTQEATIDSDIDVSTDSATLGEENALESAESYLEFSSFSYQGLVEQLEFEGYSNEEAVYAVNNCGADWNEQAAKTAQSYIDLMSFSRQELIDQLEFEGFTPEQAEYGVKAVGY